MEENSVDSIVTDPPYELGFMGEAWDSTGIAYSVSMWRECLRVLKPGGHLLSFGGSRTYHRMTCAIEDAGFQIRDQIMWLYGSGFPKSLDVSKAIDKTAGRIGKSVVELKRVLRTAHDASGRTLAEFNALCGFEASGYLRETSSWASVLPDIKKWGVLRNVLNLSTDLDSTFAEAERELAGLKPWTNSVHHFVPGEDHKERVALNDTLAATDAAKQWSGWGTALKPAHEPICVARKPLIGTVAANVLEHGTGAINIDGCRVETTENLNGGAYAKNGSDRHDGDENWRYKREGGAGEFVQPQGRWPANVIHDGSEEVISLFPQTSSGTGAVIRASAAENEGNRGSAFGAESCPAGTELICYGDSGSAARFFYCAKTSKSEREAGCEDLALVPLAYGNQAQAEVKRGNLEHSGKSGINTVKMRGNNHPTVKPLALMRYLCRLVTPPGGTVLDGFMGSGTTGIAALLEAFNFIGIEINPAYAAIAEKRIREAAPLLNEVVCI
jgi:DNA modification methylase